MLGYKILNCDLNCENLMKFLFLSLKNQSLKLRILAMQKNNKNVYENARFFIIFFVKLRKNPLKIADGKLLFELV